MRRAASIVLLFGLFGCASAPPIETPDLTMNVPDEWSGGTPASGVIAPNWWTDFGDEALSATIETAVEQNYDLQAAAARLELAVADARFAAGTLMPSLQASYNGIRRKQNFVGFPIPGAEDRVLSTEVRQCSHSVSFGAKGKRVNIPALCYGECSV
jgi:multidrug efflux system outer membrane protein